MRKTQSSYNFPKSSVNNYVSVEWCTAKLWPGVVQSCIGDYMIYGFLKAASNAICRIIKFDKPVLAQDGDTLYLQRSLRAKTAQGPRITLTKSEQIPEGAKLKFTLLVMDNSPLSLPILREMLDYGQFSGLGQWRNAGYGMFTYEIKKSS